MNVAPATPATAYRAARPLGFEIPGIPGDLRLPDPTQLPGMRGLKLKFDVNAKGEILVTSNLLGLLPVTSAIDPDAALAGKYGRAIQADMRDPANTALSGDVTYHNIPVGLPALDLGGTGLAQAFSFMSAKVPEPNRVLVDGRYRSGKDGLPFHAEIKATKVANAVYDLDMRNLKLGSINFPIPAFLAAAVAWFMLRVMRGVDGVTVSGFGRLRIDLRAATASANRSQAA